MQFWIRSSTREGKTASNSSLVVDFIVPLVAGAIAAVAIWIAEQSG